MSVESFYKPVTTLSVPTHGHSHVQGEILTIPNSPFLPDKLGDLGFVGIGVGEEISSDAAVPLRRVSKHHGRSFEFAGGQKIIWSDEFGNIYTTMNVKGNNLENPHVVADPNNALNYSVFGLQTSVGILRQIKASKLMRSAEIETEAISHVIEPLMLPYKGELVSIEEFKKKLVDGAVEGIVPKLQTLTKGDVAKTLANVAFFETVRSVAVNERIWDFVNMPEREREIALQNVFFYANLYEKTKGKKDSSYTPLSFDIENSESIEMYLNEYLPKKIGQNYAKLHGLGLVHTFANLSNVSFAGGIVDLDSIQGYPFNDDPYKWENISDLGIFINEIKTWNNIKPFIPNVDKFIENLKKAYMEIALQSKSHHNIFFRNIIDLSVVDSDKDEISKTYDEEAPIEFLEQVLEESEVLNFDVEAILKMVVEEQVYKDNGDILTKEEKGVLFNRIIEKLVESGYDRGLWMYMNDQELMRLALKVMGVDIDIDGVKIIYDEVTTRKAAELLEPWSESISGAFGKPPQDQNPDGTDDAFDALCEKIIYEFGWDKDLLTKAATIDVLLDLRSTARQKRVALKRQLLDQFSEQTGIAFPWKSSSEEVLEDFFEEDRKLAKEMRDIMNGDIPSTVERLGALAQYFNEKHGQDRFTNYVLRTIDEWAEKLEFREVLVNATEDFANSDALYKWFNMTATDTALALPDDIEKDLDDRAKKMVAEYIYVASHND
jgi:hypothetical protein